MKETLITASAPHAFRPGDVICLSSSNDRRVITAVTANTMTVRLPRWYELAWWAIKQWCNRAAANARAWWAVRRLIRRAKKP